jgi:hypothetical protein
MAVGIIEEFHGSDIAFYDAVCEKINFPEEWPEGLLYHAAGETENGGVRIVEQWDYPQQYTQFIEDTIRPAIGELLGSKAESAVPVVTVFPIHSVQTQTGQVAAIGPLTDYRSEGRIAPQAGSDTR